MTLEELYEELKDMDISEPSCMDKIKLYFEELEEEDDEFMELLLSKLDNEVITWEQPWYQQTKCLSRPLKEPEEQHDETYNTDSMSKEEIDLIHKNWRKFKKKYDIPNKIICLARWKNKGKSRHSRELHVKHFVVAYLARGLKRNLYQVLRHIMTYYGSPVKGDYSAFEEKLMDICFQYEPKHAVVILSKVLGREPRGIYKRLGYTVDVKPQRKKLKWTLPLATKFLNLLLEYSNCSLEELKHKKIEKSIWLKLEKDIDQQYIYLQSFWHDTLKVQLFVKEYITLRSLRKKIFKKLKKSTYQVWPDIRWKELVKEFSDGYTHRFLYRIAYNTIKHMSNYLKRPLQEIVHYALASLKCGQYYHTKRLRTLILNEEGHLEPIQYDKLYLVLFSFHNL
ncbi:uncharacterized protein LOC113518517 [Galleria mellonella]|uniref:Uncharacterized protein LOC113518517 n=1 Tax=Galleria mellonella TaxID=7137 RepID=A0A6J3CDI6_GALME|nr:uncharacterized protein LOC113518517 [Galleria mellonella]